MVEEESIHKISLCLRISIWILSIIYTISGIFLLLLLLKWFIGFPYIEPLEVDLKYLSLWKVSSYFVIVLLFFVIASLSLCGAIKDQIFALLLSFILLILKFMIHFVLLFEMVFLEPFHQEKGKEEEVKRATNFFLSFSIFPLLTDLILMANVFDLRNQIISYNSTFNESHSERKLIRKTIPYRDRRIVKITIDAQNKKSSNNQVSKPKKVEKNGTISKEVRVTEDKETTNSFETFDDEYYSED